MSYMGRVLYKQIQPIGIINHNPFRVQPEPLISCHVRITLTGTCRELLTLVVMMLYVTAQVVSLIVIYYLLKKFQLTCFSRY